MAKTTTQSTPEATKMEVQAKRISSIISGKITYSFDPEKMTVRQWEAVERELIAADYYELMREHGNYCARPDIITPMFDENNPEEIKEFEKLAKKYEESDQSEAAKKARDYWRRRLEKAKSYSKTLQKLHANLLNTGGRLKIVCALLTPDGKPYTAATAQDVEANVIPTMTQSQAEDVLSNFLNSPQLVEHLSLNYLREYTPQKS